MSRLLHDDRVLEGGGAAEAGGEGGRLAGGIAGRGVWGRELGGRRCRWGRCHGSSVGLVFRSRKEVGLLSRAGVKGKAFQVKFWHERTFRKTFVKCCVCVCVCVCVYV